MAFVVPAPPRSNSEIRKDVGWFCAYAEQGNGVHLLPPPIRREWVIECDSCLMGGGSVLRGALLHRGVRP